MHHLILTWDSFQNHSSDAEAASISKFCRFSLSTMEIACCQGTEKKAMVEQEHPDAWRWAVISPDGFVIDGGSEPTLTQAKKAVEQSLHLETSAAG